MLQLDRLTNAVQGIQVPDQTGVRLERSGINPAPPLAVITLNVATGFRAMHVVDVQEDNQDKSGQTM